VEKLQHQENYLPIRKIQSSRTLLGKATPNKTAKTTNDPTASPRARTKVQRLREG
jgi:hypothetical protein